MLLAQAGAIDEGLRPLETMLSKHDSTTDPLTRLDTRLRLAKFLVAVPHLRGDAIDYALEARDGFARMNLADELQEARGWLAEHEALAPLRDDVPVAGLK
ncbi:MAG: hypothetical protein JKY37_22015 [Nannocystaceae bacterium]|nr:hypothetical protein [Nannocystaceae bacterium]